MANSLSDIVGGPCYDIPQTSIYLATNVSLHSCFSDVVITVATKWDQMCGHIRDPTHQLTYLDTATF